MKFIFKSNPVSVWLIRYMPIIYKRNSNINPPAIIMNILCATDNNYVQHCYIMLLSLFDNNLSHEIDVYVLVSGLTAENEKILGGVSSDPAHRVNIIKVDVNLDYCPVREWDNISIATYYRILAPMLLPKDIDKILYLDVDAIVTADLLSLYNTNIEKYAVGGVIDSVYYSDIYERLGYSPSLSYINAGVLLINLAYWRENNIMEECLEYIKTYPEKCIWHDQDATNYVLREKKILLPLIYNFQMRFLLRTSRVEPDIEQEIHNIVKDKLFAIIHYTTDKPWRRGGRCPYKEYYRRYKKLSPYAKVSITRERLTFGLIKRRIYSVCAWLGLVKPVRTYIVKQNGELDLD